MPTTSQRFNDPTGDLTFRSSDNVAFKVHRKNLAAHSGAFAAAAETTQPSDADKDEIQLQDPETAAVLDLLFQYMYPQPQPDLQRVNFRLLAALAETVEKYEVYSALPAVRTRMRECIPTHPMDVWQYAEKHGHQELADEAKWRLQQYGVPFPGLEPSALKKWV
ncbi:hypothetical protein B0H19DRAFT_1264520 [Mycena capillaripes]|nr:hypothetical protein B0H19DRAFT_1264520 [Mycena capillaripes]